MKLIVLIAVIAAVSLVIYVGRMRAQRLGRAAIWKLRDSEAAKNARRNDR